MGIEEEVKDLAKRLIILDMMGFHYVQAFKIAYMAQEYRKENHGRWKGNT